MLPLKQHTEPLEPDELSFLHRKEEKERKQYYSVLSVLMVLCFVLPFAGAWYRAYEGAPNAFSPLRFFVSAAILLSLCIGSMYFVYKRNLARVQADIKEGNKTVECAHVVRKLHMAGRNAFYLYLDSPNKLSIEVKEEDYYSLDDGDEVNIEFTRHSRLYLGYY